MYRRRRYDGRPSPLQLYYKENNNNEINKDINKLNLNNYQRNINISNDIDKTYYEKKGNKYLTKKRTYTPKKYYFSPIIKSKNVVDPIIKFAEFGSATRLSAINLDDLDKINEDNFSSKSIIIVRSENKKANKIFRKYQFFRSNKYRRKDNDDIKNCSSPNSASTIDLDPIIE